MSLDKVFSPRGIAVVGASDNAKKFGGLTLENLIKGGYQGNLAPINAARPSVMGLKSYAKVSAAPGPIDVAVLAIPKRAIPDAIRDCAAAKVQYLVMMTGGYSETGEAGRADEKEMIALARSLGMRVLGPNLLGLASSPSKVLMNASLAMREVPARLGNISLVSQSGAAMGVLYNRGAREGVAFRHLIALGNQADIEIADVLEYYASDTGTKVVMCSVEGLRDPERFLAAAKLCHAAGKPLLLVKSGRTSAGAVVAATHTGSLASAYSAFAARCETAGIVLVESELAMVRLAFLYDKFGEAPQGCGIALLSPSGGALVQTTDVATETGVRLSKFSAETVKRLEEQYTPGLTANPLDFANLRDNSFVDVGDGGAKIVSEDSDVGGIIGVLGTAHNLDEMVTAMTKAVDGRKPIVFAVLPGSNGDKARVAAAELGALAVDSIEDSVEVFRRWYQARPTVKAPAERPKNIARVDTAKLPKGAMLGEFEAKALLGGYGVGVSREAKAANADQAVQEADKIGYPVVLKGFGATLIHKSDQGAVKLHLADAGAVRAAWADIAKSVGAGLEGCVVAEMVRGEAELIVGALHDPQFGPMVMFGAGGILAELIEDVVVLAAPADPATIRAKLETLKVTKILKGIRGKPACDIDAAVDAIYRVSLFAADGAPAVAELDINPLIVRKKGAGAVAVDARIRIAD